MKMFNTIIISSLFILVFLFKSEFNYIDIKSIQKKKINIILKNDSNLEKYEINKGSNVYDFMLEHKIDLSYKYPLSYIFNDGDVVNLNSKKPSINKVDIDELSKIPYISKEIATKIIEYRETRKFIKDIEELKEISGIGETRLRILKEFLEV